MWSDLRSRSPRPPGSELDLPGPNSQRFYGRAPLAGDDLHQLEAGVVQLHLCGVVVLGVDLGRPEWTAVFGLRRETETETEEIVGSRRR